MTYQEIKLKIEGMECASCEVLLERKFKSIEGVKEAHVNHGKSEAKLLCTKIPSLEILQQAVKDTKYKISFEEKTNSKNNSTITITRDNIEIGGILLIVLSLYLILKYLNMLPDLGISDKMSYGFIFLIGLVAAFSTCMAVAGGLLMAVSAKYNETHPNLSNKQKFRPHIYFNIGRIISYTILGGLLGVIGSVFKISPKVNGFITIFASIIMIILGLQLLKIFPWFNKIKFKMPKFIAHKIHDASISNSKSAPFLLGAATFFLPCGFTQALQIYVISQGSFLTGALTMFAFSLGTLPTLISVGAIQSFSAGNFKRYFTKFVAILVIILGLVNIGAGLNLTGANFGSLIPSANAEDISGEIINGKQIIKMKVSGLDYYPSRFNIVKNIPVEWHINGKNAQGCAQIISVPNLGITERLLKNTDNIIQFTPQKEGIIKFSCGMGMAGPGIFNVIKK